MSNRAYILLALFICLAGMWLAGARIDAQQAQIDRQANQIREINDKYSEILDYALQCRNSMLVIQELQGLQEVR